MILVGAGQDHEVTLPVVGSYVAADLSRIVVPPAAGLKMILANPAFGTSDGTI